MKEIFASTTFGTIGLIFFFVFFVGVLIWVVRPGTKQKYKEDAQIPLKENDNEQ